MQPSLPPTPFADSGSEPAIYWGEDDHDSMTTTTSGIGSDSRSEDLDAFLATVAVTAPAPATEITPEEILSYIIPPPPDSSSPMYDRVPIVSFLSCILSKFSVEGRKIYTPSKASCLLSFWLTCHKIGPKGALGSREIRPIHSAPSLGQSIVMSCYFLASANEYCPHDKKVGT